MPTPPPMKFVFYFAAEPAKVWDAFISPETNRTIFSGADFEIDPRPGGAMNWVGPGPDGKPMAYVRSRILAIEPPRLFQYTFAMGPSQAESRVTIELIPESEATQVTVTHDNWTDDDPAYPQTADGWPRILSRLKTLLETGKTFRPH
jgi:uncharacterized protein YndB with AHSA1/START domain